MSTTPRLYGDPISKQGQTEQRTITVVVPTSGTLSSIIELQGDLMAIETDSAFVGTTMTVTTTLDSLVTGKLDNSATFVSMINSDDGTDVSLDIAASEIKPVSKIDFLGLRFIKLGFSAQSAGTTIKLLVRTFV
jgi:hypothetical protein